ncbi:MAG: hypothetical protein LBN12_04020, partial [Clostridiales Family XIII bacterium]|nr:hypothetical protein [Clostridiales Family XIII bacterium]
EDPDDDPDDPPVDPPTPPVVPPADPPESPEGGFTEPTDPEADSESGTTGTTTTVSKISGFDLDDMTKLEAQSGNIFNNLANGNVPLGGFYAKGAWSALDLILAIIAVILSVILSIGALGKRKDRQKKAGVGFMRSLAISAGIIVLILTVSIDDFSQPVTWVNQWTPLVGIVFALQIVLFAAYKITAARATASIGNADIDL